MAKIYSRNFLRAVGIGLQKQKGKIAWSRVHQCAVEPCPHTTKSECGIFSQAVDDKDGKRVEVIAYVCGSISPTSVFFAKPEKCTRKLMIAFDFAGNIIYAHCRNQVVQDIPRTEVNFHEAVTKNTKIARYIVEELKRWGIIITPRVIE